LSRFVTKTDLSTFLELNNVETGEQSLSSILDNDEIVGMTRDFNRDTGLQTLDSFLYRFFI